MHLRGARLLLIGTLLAPNAAHAAPKPSFDLSVATRGMSKGIAQTTGPQALARGELSFGTLYVGAYAKNVDSPAMKGESAAYLGFRTKAAGFDLNASAAWKREIAPAPHSQRNALEVSGSIARKLGRLTPRLSVVWSPDDLGATTHSTFLEAGAAYSLAKTLAFTAAVGRRQRGGGSDYTAWNAGLAWTPRRNVVLDARYYDTDGTNAQPYRARGVVAAHLKF